MFGLGKLFTSSGVDPKRSDRIERDFFVINQGSNYQVLVDIAGDAPYSTCIISINVVTGGERQLPIAARYSWKKMHRGQEQDISLTGNTLHLSPLDAGYFIKVYVTPIEEENIYREVSTVIFGPIALDPLVKRTLQGIIRAGGFKFQVERIMLAESDEYGCDGIIMLAQNYLHIVSRKNPNLPIRVFLGDKFKITSHRNQLKNLMIEFPDDAMSKEIARLLSIPVPRTFRKLRIILSSPNSKDLLILAINIFKTMQTAKDTEVFQLVTEYMKESSPVITHLKSQGLRDDDDSDSLEGTGERDTSSPSAHLDAIDQLFLHNSLRDEVQKLYLANKDLAEERKKLQMKVVDLEGELSRTLNRSSHLELETQRKPEHIESPKIDPSKIAMVRQKNNDIATNIKTIETQNQNMKVDIDRMTKIFKQMRYKELLESKLNATANRAPEKDISNLERALDDYAKDYQKLMGNLNKNDSPMLENIDADRSLSLVDEIEDRTLEITMKNERVKEDIQRAKAKLAELESKKEVNRMGASFIGNDSFLMPSARIKNETKIEYELKIDQLEGRIKRINLENNDLDEQVNILKKKLGEQEEEDQEAKIFRKLKIQQQELKSILEVKTKKNSELMRIKIALADQEMDMKSVTQRATEAQYRRIEDLKLKRDQLERQRQSLARDLQIQREKEAKLKAEHEEYVNKAANTSMAASPGSAQADKLRSIIRGLEEKIVQAEKTSGGNKSPSQQLQQQPNLTKAEVDALDNERKMNARLINEITRLNEIIRKNNEKRDVSIL